MISRCLVCAAPFEPNESLEHLPLGGRFAYDPARGRLWAVCRHCRRWNLAPIETRWEALEELERLAGGRARLLSQTENIALLRAGNLELVRVGRAQRAEEAWWRYGRELADRRQRFKKISTIGTVAVGATIVGGWATGAVGFFGSWILWKHAPDKVTDAARWLRFGRTAWRGEADCPRCGYSIQRIRYRERRDLVLLYDDERRTVGMATECPRCRKRSRELLRLAPAEAERTARRILAYHHFSGASETRVLKASRLIEEAGSPARFARAGNGERFGYIERTYAIALEIAANETNEQRMLEMELAELEAVWREEEEIAAIADGELTPLPLLEALRRRLGPGGARLS